MTDFDFDSGELHDAVAAEFWERGRVVREPEPRHRCDPGVTWATTDAGVKYLVTPNAYLYPKGTVWECACGRRWVSRGTIYVNEPGGCYWRRERLLSRLWRRLFDRDRNAEDLAETSAWERGKADTR